MANPPTSRGPSRRVVQAAKRGALAAAKSQVKEWSLAAAACAAGVLVLRQVEPIDGPAVIGRYIGVALIAVGLIGFVWALYRAMRSHARSE